MSVIDARIAFCLEVRWHLGRLYRWGDRDCSKLVHLGLDELRDEWPDLYDGARRTASDYRRYYRDRGCPEISQPAELLPGCLVFLSRPGERIHHVRIHLYTSPKEGHVAIEAGGGDSDNTSDKRSLQEAASIRLVASDRPSGGWWGAIDPFFLLP